MFWDNLKHWNYYLFFLLKHVLLEISSGGILSGGILSGGILSGGILEWGDIVRGILSWGDIVRGDIVRGDIVRGDIVRGDIVLIPYIDTVNSENIALIQFLRFLALSLGRKIKIRNV